MKFEFFIHDRRVRPWGQALVAARSWCCDERCTTDVADLPRFELGNMNMAIAGRAPSGDSASRGVRSGTGGFGALSAHAAKLLALAALSLTMALAGCAQNSAQHEVKTDPIEAAAPPQGHPDFRIRRPNRALLLSQPAPDCEFRSTELKTVDPDQWGRLRLDYERQCYQQAEKKVRDRLRSDPAGDHPVTGSAATGRVHQRPDQMVIRPFTVAVRSYRSHTDPGPLETTDTSR